MVEAKIIKIGLKESWKTFVGALHVSPLRLLVIGVVTTTTGPL